MRALRTRASDSRRWTVSSAARRSPSSSRARPALVLASICPTRPASTGPPTLSSSPRGLAACPRRRDTSLQALRLVSCLAQLRVASCRRRTERAHLLLELRDARRAPRELGLQFARLCVAAGELTACARQVALAFLDLALQLGRQPFEDQPAALGALQRLEVTEGPLPLALQVAQDARGAGTILLRQPALLELQGALRARGAFLFPELALQLVGARTLSAQHSARLRHLLLGLRARTRQLIQLKRQFGTHLPEFGVELRGALLGGRARRIRRVAGALDRKSVV